MELTLEPAVLLRRYRRFLADVRLPDGREITVHVPNTGSMATLADPGRQVWLARATNPNRKLSHTLTLVGTPDGGVAVVDTMLPNRMASEAIAAGSIGALSGYPHLSREVRYGTRGSRIDILLSGHRSRPDAYVEVKNVTMLAGEGRADFPDAVSERGRKHLAELQDVAANGQRGVQLYLINRTDCTAAGIAASIDPAYAAAAMDAAAHGVEFLAYRLACIQDGGHFSLSLRGPCAVSGLGVRRE